MEWKKRGNEFFKQKNYLKAINCYEESLYILKQRKEELIKIEKGKLLTSEGEEDLKELSQELINLATSQVKKKTFMWCNFGNI
jgi:tetratricopeptide (TPR) repeat protein